MATLTKEQKEQARQETVQDRNGAENPAIAFLEAEVAKLEESIAPTMEEIAKLEASVESTKTQIELTKQAIRVMRGEGARPLPQRSGTRARRSSSESGTTPASQIDRDAILKLIAASDDPIGATDIRNELGYAGQGLSLVLKEMVDDGQLTKTGEKRGTKYSVA